MRLCRRGFRYRGRGLLVALADLLNRLRLARDRHQLEALALVDRPVRVVLDDFSRKVLVELLEE